MKLKEHTSIIVLLLTLFTFTCPAEEISVFDRPGAQLTTKDGKVKALLEGCKLYTDKEFVMKTRPRQLSVTRYILANFDGGKVRCEREGVAFLLALVDPNSQEQTKSTLTFIEANQWIPVPEIPEFSLYYTNGADRPAKLYWKQIALGAEIQNPKGSILCFRYKP